MLTRAATRRCLLAMALFLAIWQVVVPAQAVTSLSHPCCDTVCDPAMPCAPAECQVCVDRALEVKSEPSPLLRLADVCPPASHVWVVRAAVESIWRPPR